ncbi:MAG: DUF3369 domain-containing protein [Magnetococcales bacterium]|nr:DUF3369 domain-containing protein [Magnetococcales bacterium]
MMVKKIIRNGGKAAEEDAIFQVRAWRILAVDDEPDVLTLTLISLSDFHFDGRPLEVVQAGSAEQARQILAEGGEFAVALIDVVMETPDAGLQLVKYIRDTLHNPAMRLIIRTGQPGLAPERKVIDDYDIDDYKEKTELTSWRLYTTVRTSLKSYRDLMSIEYNRLGLARILDAAPELYCYRSLEQFFHGVLHQMSALLPSNHNSFLVGARKDISAMFASSSAEGTQWVLEAMQIRCGLGRYAEDSPARESVLRRCIETLRTQSDARSLVVDNRGNVVAPLSATGHLFGMAYLELNRPLSEADQQFLQIFALQCGSALENLQLFAQVEEARDSLKAVHHHAVYMLAVASEYKDQETGNHIQRIAHYVQAIAESLGWSTRECEAIAEASVLHDLGKISIPDAILQKPGRLTEEEFAVVRTHCALGARILGEAPGFQLASEIALHHHEQWDGSGYPSGLKGEAIPLPARIVAVADVFDALVSERPYKKAWSVETALAEIEKQAWRQFDPMVVRAFLEVHQSGRLQTIRTEMEDY